MKRVVNVICKHYVNSVYKLRFNALSDPDKLIYVDIDNICGFMQDKYKLRFSCPGTVKRSFNNINIINSEYIYRYSLKYNAIYDRFVYNKDWVDTDLFQKRYYYKILADGKFKKCDNINELASYYEDYYSALYKSIKKYGIIPDEYDSLYVHIGKNGEQYYTSNGNHRLFICKILGIKSLPCKVWWRHIKWQNIRDKIYDNKSLLNSYMDNSSYNDLLDLSNDSNYVK